jgi:hypothetical protein
VGIKMPRNDNGFNTNFLLRLWKRSWCYESAEQGCRVSAQACALKVGQTAPPARPFFTASRGFRSLDSQDTKRLAAAIDARGLRRARCLPRGETYGLDGREHHQRRSGTDMGNGRGSSIYHKHRRSTGPWRRVLLRMAVARRQSRGRRHRLGAGKCGATHHTLRVGQYAQQSRQNQR